MSRIAEPNTQRDLSLTDSTESEYRNLKKIRPHTSDTRPAFTHPLLDEKTPQAALVDFDAPEDPYKAVNWPTSKKVYTTLLYASLTACTTWSSSIYSLSVNDIAQEFGVSRVVATLGTSMFLFGLGLGPLLWAPISEIYGRKTAAQIPFFIGCCFAFGWATAKDFQTLMLTRFFGGFFASAPLVNTGGVLADLYTPQQRAAAMAGYQMSVVGGPLIAPIVGGAIVQSHSSWRWTAYVTGILSCFVLMLHVLFVEESFGNALLVTKARTLRFESGNWSLHCEHEEWNVSLKTLAEKYLVRPFQLLMTPICFAMCLYAAFVYSLIYLSFTALPIVFEQNRGWNSVVGALPFIGTFVGCLIGAVLNLWLNGYYLRMFEANNFKPVPEARLLPMMVGGVILAAALFIFGWTSAPQIPWIAPVIGLCLLGIAFIMIFQGAINYLVDTFQAQSASAVAANTVMRSMLAGGFPLFTDAMFNNLGVAWAASLLGFLAVVLIPIPFLFFAYGRQIRARGKWSVASTE